jgi:hypothetical protein
MTFGDQLPRPWLRACAIGVAVSGFLWVATGVAWSHPNGLLMVVVGGFLLPIGVALARDLDGMAKVWGRRALAPFRIGAGNAALDEDNRARVAAVREEATGRQAGGGLILIAAGWIALGFAAIAGVLRA